MSLALCRCKASKPADIVTYFIPKFFGIATKQMCKDNGKLWPKSGLSQSDWDET